MRDKIVLLDCDNVLLDWNFEFHKWLIQSGHTTKPLIPTWAVEHYNSGIYYDKKDVIVDLVKTFNMSAHIGRLGPMPGAIPAIRQMYEDGYAMRIITALGTDPFAMRAREENLNRVFGDVFDSIEYVELGESKISKLEPYRNSSCLFVEDNVRHANEARKIGLDVNVIPAAYNTYKKGLDYRITRDPWPTVAKITRNIRWSESWGTYRKENPSTVGSHI